MSDETIRYDLLAHEALRGVVRLALERAAQPKGLPGEHHFYITFLTRHVGVSLPPHLQKEYPDTMTVVIKQHYWDLEVDAEGFSVGLSFHGKPEKIRVAHAAVLRFSDPEAQFDLSFTRPEVPSEARVSSAGPLALSPSDAHADVVSLDAFRKR